MNLMTEGRPRIDPAAKAQAMNPLPEFLVRLPRRLCIGFAMALVLGSSLHGLRVQATPTTVQILPLVPGWNAVSFYVLPPDPRLDVVFNGIDVDSVWAYDNGLGAPDFVRDVSEQTLAKAGWRSWVPSSRPDSFQNDLLQVQVNRAYLVKLKGTEPASVTVTGRPSLRRIPWLPDSFNFRGLPVDPAVPPTFSGFFQPSAAHYSSALGLTAIYRLSGAGAWQRVLLTDLAVAGEAYWIYCRGGSDYAAPLQVNLDFGDGLDFAETVDELRLGFRNYGGSGNVTVRDLAAPTANPLSRAVRPVDGKITWPALASPFVEELPSVTVVGEISERIAVRRADMTSDVFETVLEITDDVGSRWLLPVSAARSPVPPVGSVSAGKAGVAGARARLASSPPASVHVGLWAGVATIQAVSEAHSGPLTTNVLLGYTIQLETNVVTHQVTTNRTPNGLRRDSVSMTPTPTGSEFRLHLILHVDQTGQTRLLKEVIQMWQEATTTNDVHGVAVVDRAGRPVLLTDDSLIGRFSGLTARDGVRVGRRLSTAAFDFPDNDLPLAGDFAIGSTVRGTNSMSDTFARNPFKHRYHPDHARGYDLTRVIELEVSPPPANPPPGYGDSVLDGLYRETVTGLHRTNIVVGGIFRLTRLTPTAELNPQP